MNAIKERERGEEARFASEQQSEFNRNVRLFGEAGLWAAGLLKKADPEAYAESFSALVFANPIAIARQRAMEILASDLAGLADQAEILAKFE